MVTVLRWSSWGPIVKYHKFWVFIVIGTFSCLLLNVCSIYIYSGKKIHEFYRGVFFIIGKTHISQARNLLLRQVAYVSESWDEEEEEAEPNRYLPSDILWGVLQDGKLNNIKVFVIIFSITSNYPYQSQLSEIIKKFPIRNM